MKKHTFTRWMIVIILSIYGLTNTGMAQPITEKDDPAPTPKVTAPPPIKVSTTSFEDILVPWLMKNGQPVEQLDWVKDQKTKEITFTRQNKCQTVVKTGEIKWLPKFNTVAERQAYHDKWMDLRTWYGIIKGYGYEDKRELDSLARVTVATIRGKFDSRPLITSIYTNSPNVKQLKALSAKDADIERRLKALEGPTDSLTNANSQMNTPATPQEPTTPIIEPAPITPSCQNKEVGDASKKKRHHRKDDDKGPLNF